MERKKSPRILENRVTTGLVILAVMILQGFVIMTWKLDDFHSRNCDSNQVKDMATKSMDGHKTKGKNLNNNFMDVTFPSLGRDWTTTTNNFGGVQARAFPSWPFTLPLPCSKPETNWPSTEIQRSPSHEGFLMVREMKTGSSTAVGINLRIARNVARRHLPQYKICKLRNDHANAARLDYRNRNHTKSFLWTILRDPTQRCLSQFFHFQVSRLKTEPTDKNFIKWIEENRFIHHYYLQSLSMEEQNIHMEGYDAIAAANQILQAYDFVGVTERLDESAVALQLLLGLATGDILYLNSKNSGGFDDGASPRGCVYIVPKYVSGGMKEYFASPSWEKLALADTLLHRAANRSLDLTIAQLGKERFQMALDRFRHAQRIVKERCLPIVQFPCTSGGEPVAQPNCFWGDTGCGVNCIDEVADYLNLYTPI